MKKLILLATIMILMFASPAIAVEIVRTNQSTVAWDAVTTFDSGEDIPIDMVVNYRLHKKNLIAGTEEIAGQTTDLQYTLTFLEQGFFWAGVSSFIVYDDPANAGQTIENESEITWSDNDDPVRVPIKFCIANLLGPHYVEGFVSK